MHEFSAGMVSLATSVPKKVRHNDYYEAICPEAIAKRRNMMWNDKPQEDWNSFDKFAAPYAQDPFRGTVARYVLNEGESIREHELAASKAALEGAKLKPSDLDAIISVCMISEDAVSGHGVHLARGLGADAVVFNLEATCSASTIALETAASMVSAGRHRNVLVSISCRYSQVMEDGHPVAWSVGDGAAAFVVGRMGPKEGICGYGARNTSNTIGTFWFEHQTVDSKKQSRMLASRSAGGVLRDTTEDYIRGACLPALKQAKMTASDLDLFAPATPAAWMADVASETVGVVRSKIPNGYPVYGNIGPALMPFALQEAHDKGMLHGGDSVLVYAIGTVSSCAAAVMRWGMDVPVIKVD